MKYKWSTAYLMGNLKLEQERLMAYLMAGTNVSDIVGFVNDGEMTLYYDFRDMQDVACQIYDTFQQFYKIILSYTIETTTRLNRNTLTPTIKIVLTLKELSA